MENRIFFNMNIAGVSVSVGAGLESTKSFCYGYITGDPGGAADIDAVITQADIDYVRRDGEADERDKNLPHFFVPDRQAEQLALHKLVSDQMPAFNRALFHSSAVAVDGEAVLFTAPSGTGKSTHARLWKQLFGDRLVYINDDKPYIGYDGEAGPLTVYGSPWMGTHRVGANTSAPIKAIGIIERSPDNHTERMNAAQAFATLFNQAYRPRDVKMLTATMNILKRVAEEVPIYTIYCNMEPEAAQAAYSAIFK
ncbi:MAG: hypothetical protein IKR26_02255 [Lachnospiraceae bacterium]|nr:hypothetical protein [Lachnospiraceae bacterium]